MIGIGAMVAVLGLSESSKSDLLSQLDALGTNMLQVQASTGIGLGPGTLPDESIAMASRIGPVQIVSSVGDVAGAHIYKNDLVPDTQTGGLSVVVADPNLLETLQGTMAEGVFLDEASPDFPVTVLGSVTADRLGIRDLDASTVVWLGDEWFAVVGIMDTLALSPDIDRAALVSVNAAETYLEYDGVIGTIYVRVDPSEIDDARNVMPATVSPENPDQVQVTRPSDALEAREAADTALTNLFLGLGAVALLVGGVGIANGYSRLCGVPGLGCPDPNGRDRRRHDRCPADRRNCRSLPRNAGSPSVPDRRAAHPVTTLFSARCGAAEEELDFEDAVVLDRHDPGR
jgi:putative ABC transport system permease protein